MRSPARRWVWTIRSRSWRPPTAPPIRRWTSSGSSRASWGARACSAKSRSAWTTRACWPSGGRWMASSERSVRGPAELCPRHATLHGIMSPARSPKRLFRSKDDWANWLDENGGESLGIWLRLAKKDSGLKSVSYKEALDVALCYGWIDGQKQAENEQTWLQRFVPRSTRSVWSKINRERALALIASGEMKPAGLA